MEYYALNISHLNDFLFCPYSIYLHNVYQSLDEDSYHDIPQVKGKIAHQSIDNNTYSTKKSVVTSMMVFSVKYGLVGKIDQYFYDSRKLIERKRFIKRIYDGYKLQLYAQYFCLIEMGFDVDYLGFYSLSDNRSYNLPIPDNNIIQWFESYLDKVRSYNPLVDEIFINSNKCLRCIYYPLCDKVDI